MNRLIVANSLISANSQQVTGHLPDGDTVILSLRDGVYYGLNEVGSSIWNSIQSPTSVQELLHGLLTEYDVDAEQCHLELITLLEELAKHGLIHVEESVEPVAGI